MRWFEFLKNAKESPDFEKYIDEHWKEVPEEDDVWSNICAEPLRESFIEEHFQYVNWPNICRYSNLSEAFIEKHLCCIDWRTISANQYLTEEFVLSHRYDVDWSSLLCKYQFSEDVLMDLIEDPNVKIDIGNVLNNQSLQLDTARKLREMCREQEIHKNLIY